jgi:hypothetical protein
MLLLRELNDVDVLFLDPEKLDRRDTPRGL